MNVSVPPGPAASRLDPDALRRAAQGDAAPLSRISAALRRRDEPELAAVRELSAVEAAGLVLQLKPKDARLLLALLPDTPNLAVLGVLDPAIRAKLIDEAERARLARTLAGLDVPFVADLLAGLPAAAIEPILAAHPRAQEIRAAISYGIETAGAAMLRRQLVAVPPDWTLGQVIEEIRAHSADIERLYAVYVVDADRRLVGYLKLRDLLMQPAGASVRDVMRTDVVAVAAATDRETAVRLADRERLPVIPVTDAGGRLVGLISAEEIRAIGREEISEDLKALSSVAPDSDPGDGPFTILRRRFPWLVSALIGALGAGLIVGGFENALEEAVILASLIPMVMDMAGNAGIQSSTVTIEAMASASFWRGDIRGRFLRELGGAALNGAAVGIVTALGIMALSLLFEVEQPAWLALTAATTLVLITVQAAVVGILVPLGLARLKLDPAVGTGVFITTVNDFAGITILFLTAKLLYLPHL